jgi:hypothetical protein
MAEMAKEIKTKRTGEVSASADELFQFINTVSEKFTAGSPGRRRREVLAATPLLKFIRCRASHLFLVRWNTHQPIESHVTNRFRPGPRRRPRRRQRAGQVCAAVQRRADPGPAGQVWGIGMGMCWVHVLGAC